MKGIWIRSQDKNTLVCATRCLIYENSNGEYAIDCLSSRGSDEPIGKYATRKRALQVLDEIQDKINYSRLEDIAYAGVTGVAIHDGVYQMPAE